MRHWNTEPPCEGCGKPSTQFLAGHFYCSGCIIVQLDTSPGRCLVCTDPSAYTVSGHRVCRTCYQEMYRLNYSVADAKNFLTRFASLTEDQARLARAIVVLGTRRLFPEPPVPPLARALGKVGAFELEYPETDFWTPDRERVRDLLDNSAERR